jgi:hypothetical protein
VVSGLKILYFFDGGQTRDPLLQLKGFEGIREDSFFRDQCTKTRGHSMKLYKERVNMDVLKFSFGNRVIDQWNKLPEEVINTNSINSFKNRIDNYIRKKLGDS